MLSKLRSSSVLTDNLTVAQYDASENGYTVEPFSGFMYPMYAMISANATRPYTAMLFIEYLMTQEGFQPWGKSIGAYRRYPQRGRPGHHRVEGHPGDGGSRVHPGQL